MKVKNISSKTSLSTIFILLITNIIFIISVVVGYFNFTINNHSLLDFFSWLAALFNSVRQDIDIFTALLIFIIIPAVFFIGLIGAIISRSKAIKEFNSKLNLKSVEFLQGRINFKFNQPQCNITCGYNDIKKLAMTIHVKKVTNKHGSYPAVKEIELTFLLLNNKTFTITNIPLNIMKFTYSIIDYSRGMQEFSYSFQGYMEIETVKEKIEDYYKKGFKQILSKEQEISFKYASIISFVIGITPLIFYNTNTARSSDLIFSGILLIVSIIFDIFLLADKIKERKHGI